MAVPLGVVTAALLFETATAVIGALQVVEASSRLQDAVAALGTNPDQWTPNRISAAAALQQEAGTSAAQGDSALRGNLLLLGASHLPLLQDQVKPLLSLSGAINAAAQSDADLIQIARAVDASRGSSDPTGIRLLKLLGDTRSSWVHADNSLSKAMDGLRKDGASQTTAPPIAALTQQATSILQPLATEARIGVAASQFGPAALGGSGAQSYLVLLPNPSEQRPAGGFSGAVGTVVMDAGAPVVVDVHKQEDYNPQVKKPVAVPAPLGRYLKFYKNSLELGDAGWDPDFPSTAAVSEQLYTSATNRTVTGTISVDPYAMSALLGVTGPVDVPGYGSFDDRNFFPKLNEIVNVSTAPGSGKAALGPISQAVLQKVLTQPASSWPRIFNVLHEQADQRHIQAQFHDQALSAAAAQVHYDGAVLGQDRDYLMVCDANVGATKGDFFVKKSIEVRTEVPGTGIVRHQVTVDYRMPAAIDAVDRALNPGDGSYRDYVRFYIPETANVAAFRETVDGQAAPGGIDAVTMIHGRQSVGAFFRVPRGHNASLTLTYEVPVQAGSSYAFRLQKQAGVDAIPTHVVVSYPGGQSNQTSQLLQDMLLSVQWP
ncbi:MAG: DUF4012 domain-containing protein [Candidatus Dormibacteraeota bacterium]|nr:DUF4012 domain-containing protein [Candidatus Dormibacteraeota bacterium]